MVKLKEWFAKCVSGPLAREAVKRSIIPAGITVGTAYATADSVSMARVLVCLAVVVLAPVVSFALLRRLARLRSNLVNALTLAAFVLLDLLCGLIAVRWTIAGWLSAAVVAALTAGGLFYSVWMMTFALKLENN